MTDMPSAADRASSPSAIGNLPSSAVCGKRPGATSAMGDARLGAKLAEGGLRICREVEENFRAWFERNFANPRAGRIGCTSYSRAGALDDRPGDGMWYAEALDRAWADYNSPLTASEMGYITDHPLIAFQLATGITDVRGVRCMIRGLTLRTNSLQRKAYRSRYYGQENARRRMFAVERRKITKRTTTNPCPTPETFREAFASVKESVEAKLLFGGMVHDLACYVDSCLRYDGAGNIVGRNGGIKAWIAENVPELYPRYKTIMRYKALAMRLRQAMGVKDPEPTSALFGVDGGDETPDKLTRQLDAENEERLDDKNYSAENSHYKEERNEKEEGNGDCLQEDGNDSALHDKLHDKLYDKLHGKLRSKLYDTRKQVLYGEQWQILHDKQRQVLYGGQGQVLYDKQRQVLYGKPRQVSYYKQRQVTNRREQLLALLDGCANTFKELFNRIDSNLGSQLEEGQLDNQPESEQADNRLESEQVDN